MARKKKEKLAPEVEAYAVGSWEYAAPSSVFVHPETGAHYKMGDSVDDWSAQLRYDHRYHIRESAKPEPADGQE